MKKISRIIVVGGGTAGILCALALRIKQPEIPVTIIRSKALGVIGVGEGTIGSFNTFCFDYLGLNRDQFYSEASPTWKLGIKFNWGNRSHFNYCFSPNCDWKWDDQNYANGFYAQEDFNSVSQNSALMDNDKAFIKKENGDPLIMNDAVYHLENKCFVTYLEKQAEAHGIQLIDAKIEDVSCNDEGVDHLILDNGEKAHADFFVDASGFRSLLLNKSLNEPFESFGSSLFCNRAMIGTWERSDEDILPYTTSDTMSSGWSWRIDHEHHINRGYVYSSSFIEKEAAEAEFRSKNPKLGELNHLAFEPGKYRNSWVKNVVAIGNASGFVEPLEATSIGIICAQSHKLVDTLKSCHGQPNEAIRALYNNYSNELWESTRGFLALHYRLNKRLDTPFWKECREKTYLGDTIEKMLDFYKNYGPDNELMRDYLPAHDFFGIDGYLTIMTGLQLEYDCGKFSINDNDRQSWCGHQELFRKNAEVNSYSVKEALEKIRSEDWQWYDAKDYVKP